MTYRNQGRMHAHVCVRCVSACASVVRGRGPGQRGVCVCACLCARVCMHGGKRALESCREKEGGKGRVAGTGGRVCAERSRGAGSVRRGHVGQ
eukprot:1071829-Rhodomonas_salina.1